MCGRVGVWVRGCVAGVLANGDTGSCGSNTLVQPVFARYWQGVRKQHTPLPLHPNISHAPPPSAARRPLPLSRLNQCSINALNRPLSRLNCSFCRRRAGASPRTLTPPLGPPRPAHNPLAREGPIRIQLSCPHLPCSKFSSKVKCSKFSSNGA